MIVETNIDQLQPGMFIQTRGARDRVGLRKIIEIRWLRYAQRHELLVDHYSFLPVMIDGIKRHQVRRMPYSSEVFADKVRFVLEVDEDRFITSKKQFFYYKKA